MSSRARTFAGEPASVGEARCWVAEVLGAAGCGAWLVETAVLVASELVTNAVLHTASGRPGGTVRVELLVGSCRVRVSVIDGGSEECAPVVARSCPAPGLAEAPRGLYLVARWAERVGVCGGVRGRTVFADLVADSRGPGSALAVARAAGRLPQRTQGVALSALRVGPRIGGGHR